jgi:hypothetical protein
MCCNHGMKHAILVRRATIRYDNEQNGIERPTADYKNTKYIPALTIDPKDVIPEPLHMRMRIMDLLEYIHAIMRRFIGTITC